MSHTTTIPPHLLDVLNEHLDRVPAPAARYVMGLATAHWPVAYWGQALLRLRGHSRRDAPPLDGTERAALMRLHHLRHLPGEAEFDEAGAIWTYLASRGWSSAVRQALDHFDAMTNVIRTLDPQPAPRDEPRTALGERLRQIGL